MRTLEEIFADHRVDGEYADKGSLHSYLPTYERLFKPYRDRPCVLLEVGIGYGHSLRMWREYFSQAEIYGVDRCDYLTAIEGCHVVIGDSTRPETYTGLPPIDLAIDDGSHVLANQIATWHCLFPLLNMDGIYVIEDVQQLDQHRHVFVELEPTACIHDFRTEKNRFDDVLVTYRKDGASVVIW